MESHGISNTSIADQVENSKEYEQANYQWNVRVAKIYPLAYFFPKSTRDVQFAVICGREAQISVVPKSGAHSSESYGFGSSNKLVIDFQKMDGVSVNKSEGTAVVEAGITLGPLYSKLWNDGGFGAPLGGCLEVGISGYSLGGGTGIFAPLYGLLLDNILEFTMVDAKGQVHTVNSKENSDLFWALRGVGSGLIGIVTNFKIKLFPASELKLTFLEFRYDLKTQSILGLWKNWQEWLQWTENFAPYVFSTAGLAAQTFYRMQAIHIYHPEKQPMGNHTFLEKFQQIFPPPLNSDILFPTYEELILRKYPGRNLTIFPRETYAQHYAKGYSFFVNEYFDEEGLQKLANILDRVPNNIMVFMAGEAGAVWDIAPTATSYVHRNSLYNLVAEYSFQGSEPPLDFQEGLDWLREYLETTKFMDSGYTYQNYVDGELNDFMGRYYGENKKRLEEIKSKWDPEGYFQNPQSIPVDVVSGSKSHRFHFTKIINLLSFAYICLLMK
jgi:hypothetical protein